VEPDDVAKLGFQLGIGGELERLDAPRLQVPVFPHLRHRDVADAQLPGQQPGRPVRHAESLRRRFQRGQDHRHRVHVGGRPGFARSSNPARPSLAYRRFQAITVGLLTPTRCTISFVPTPSSASNTIRARCASPAGIDEDRVQELSTARSAGETCTSTVNGMHHDPIR
jgi:hypothetical protein